MTSSFGAAHKSLTKMQLWGAFTQEGAQTLNFSRCVNLQTLVIGYNIYKTLDASIFPHSLIELNMRYTGLEEFPDLTHQTTYLKTLDVYGNLISSIPTQRIEGLKYLEKLYIAANRIHVLPGLMKNSIKEITLAENPFTCDANVCDLRMLHDLGILDVLDEPVCETPETYEGQKVLVMNISGLECPGKNITSKEEDQLWIVNWYLFCQWTLILMQLIWG